VDAMSRLINALLDISKLESGAIRIELADFALGDLLEEMRRDFAGVASSKGLRLWIETTPLRAHSDRALVGRGATEERVVGMAKELAKALVHGDPAVLEILDEDRVGEGVDHGLEDLERPERRGIGQGW